MQCSLRLTQLRLQQSVVEAHQGLPGLYDLALLDQNIPYAPAKLRGDDHLRALDRPRGGQCAGVAVPLPEGKIPDRTPKDGDQQNNGRYLSGIWMHGNLLR